MPNRDRDAERRAAYEIARNIREAIKSKGLSQAELARLAGLAEPTVNRHLIVGETPAARRLQRCPTIAILLRYADALGVPVEDLLGRGREPRDIDPAIRAFFVDDYPRLDPQLQEWCQHTIDMMRRMLVWAQAYGNKGLPVSTGSLPVGLPLPHFQLPPADPADPDAPIEEDIHARWLEENTQKGG